MNDYEIYKALDENGLIPSERNFKILKEHIYNKNYSDYELLWALNEEGYTASDENLKIIKEELSNELDEGFKAVVGSTAKAVGNAATLGIVGRIKDRIAGRRLVNGTDKNGKAAARLNDAVAKGKATQAARIADKATAVSKKTVAAANSATVANKAVTDANEAREKATNAPAAAQ